MNYARSSILTILLLLLTLCAAAQERSGYRYSYTLRKGQSLLWKPFLGAEVREARGQGEAAVATVQDGHVLIRALQDGQAKVEATSLDGSRETALIQIREETSDGKAEFSGHYTLLRPRDHYRFSLQRLTSDLVTFQEFSWARIGKTYICISSELTGEGNAANKYDSAKKLAYEAQDGGEWEFPYGDNSEYDGREAFYEFQEANSERGGADGMELMEEFNDDFYSQLGDRGLKEYYRGTEEVLGIPCWVFDARENETVGSKFWVCPENGLCLMRQEQDGSLALVTYFNTAYQAWDDGMRP